MSVTDDIAEAAELLRDIAPELSERLRTLKVGRQKSGQVERLADQWERIAERALEGDSPRVLIEALAKRTLGANSESFWWSIWKLRGRADLRRELERRGVDYRGIWNATKFFGD